jgi:hypothetical protein
MAWNSVAPLGSVSVRANRAILGDNTSYIETTMGNSIIGTNTTSTRDHFWNVGANEDGRHRFINSPAFTVGAVPTDPVIGSGMDGVLYLKTTNSRAEWFHRNSSGIYQAVPSVKTGTKLLGDSSTYVSVTSVPANVYGEIFMYSTAGATTEQRRYRTVTGYFRSDATRVDTWGYLYTIQGSSSSEQGLKFGNGSESNLLEIQARTASATSNLTWTYIVTYRAL